MKKFLLITILGLLYSSNIFAQSITFMTYNIRYGLADDGENSWEYRKEYLASQIDYYDPDIFGTQEGLPFQVAYLDSVLISHSFIGKSRDADGKGEYSAIFYDHDKFDILEQNTFWLSPTPLIPSKGWDAAFSRICTYGLFRDKETKRNFWVINTHLDHVGTVAREKSVIMILKKIEEINEADYPLVFMGDLNAEPESVPINLLKSKLNDSKEISIKSPFGPDGTFNAFKFNMPVTTRIDYIFVSRSSEIQVKKYAVLSDSKDLKYPSDHLPVFIELNLIKTSN